MFQGGEIPQVFLRVREQDYVREKKVYQIREQKGDPPRWGPVYLCHFISSISLCLLEIKLVKHSLFQTMKIINICFSYFNSALIDFNLKRKENHRSKIIMVAKKKLWEELSDTVFLVQGSCQENTKDEHRPALGGVKNSWPKRQNSSLDFILYMLYPLWNILRCLRATGRRLLQHVTSTYQDCNLNLETLFFVTENCICWNGDCK